MAELPLLRFKPILREYLWGGRRLAELGKPLGEGECYAESWDVVDHGSDQSIVADGPLAGTTLHELVTRQGPGLLGRHFPQSQFPLLLKFLDCRKTLSVQVHPNDEQAARLDPPDLGKTEAWVVLAAEPGSKIYAGLKPGVGRAELERAVAEGQCGKCLHEFEPKVGDCIFIEAGTVHALGAGLVIAEIQQASDTTFRLFDWNRLDRDGKPRRLDIRQSLDTINYERGPVNPVAAGSTPRPYVQRLVECDKFILDRWQLETPQALRASNKTASERGTIPKRMVPVPFCSADSAKLEQSPAILLDALSTDDRFHLVAVVEGSVAALAGDASTRLRRGDSLLIPASSREVEIVPQGRAVLLDIYLP